MKKTLLWGKIFLPAVLIFIIILVGELRGSKHILDGIYILIPLIYLHQGVFCTDSFVKAVVGFALSSTVFLTFINLWFRMGLCIDLALIYLVIGVIAYGVKILSMLLEKIKQKVRNLNSVLFSLIF